MIQNNLKIYYKDAQGQERVRCVVGKWTFQDKAMSIGGKFVSFTIFSEIPIHFSIGDYCRYRGVVYTLNNLPSVSQTGKSRKVGDAFKYENVRFDSDEDVLGRIIMLDITPTTGDYIAAVGTNYTGSSNFQLFCGESRAPIGGKKVVYTAVCVLAGKIQANLDRALPHDGWKLHVNLSSTVVRKGVTQLVTHTSDKVLSFNNTTVASALSEVQNTFKLDYFIKGRDIYIGYTLGAITSDQSTIDETSANKEYFYFGYGKGYADKMHQGKSLFEIKKTVDTSQQLITRLRAMGSTKNIPYRYYNRQYGLSQSLFPQNLQLPNTFNTPAYKAARNAERKIKYPFLRAVLGDTNDAYIDKDDDCMASMEGLREGSAIWDGSNPDLEEIYPTIKETTYGELRGASCEDMDGYTESGAAAPDTNGHKSFHNYEDLERVDEILAVGFLNNSLIKRKLVDDAHIGDGIVQEKGAGSHFVDENAIIRKTTLKGTSAVRVSEKTYSAGETTLFEIKDQDAGNYILAPSFAAGICLGVRYGSNQDDFITPSYRIRIYAKKKATGVEEEIGSYTSLNSDFVYCNSGFSEYLLPSFPDEQSSHPQIPNIQLSERSDVRVTFELLFFRYIDKGTDYTITYYVGKSLKNPDTSTDYKPQYRWSEVQYTDDFLNKPFHVIIKDFGIQDWKATFSGKDKPMLVMSDGLCVAREFEINKDVQRIKYTKNGKTYNGWQLELSRAQDTSLHTYFPSKSNRLQAGDHFVLTGIMMPDAYIKAAEIRLLAAATQYLADNSHTHYTYEPHLDEIYLARNYDKCEEAGDVTKSVYWNLYAGLRFPFLGIPQTSDENEVLPIINITIESLTIKEGEGLVPKIELTLNDKIEQSTYQKVTTAVDKIYNGSLFSQFGVNSGVSASDVLMLIHQLVDNMYLLKNSPDMAHALITFLKGLHVGNEAMGIDSNGDATLRRVNVGNFQGGVSGGTLTQTEDGSYLEVDRAYFRVKAIFDSLQIARTEYSYGDRIAGHGGVKIARVEEFASFYRCYYLAEQDGVKMHNPFVVGDQAIAKEFNVKEGTTQHAANHFLWAAVIGVGDGYVDVSKGLCAAGSDAPLAGDSLCQLGYRGTDRPERQCAIIEKTTGENVPAYVMLQGINDFSLDGKDVLSFGWDSTKERAYLRDYGESYIGDRERKQYVEYTPDGGLHVNAKKVTIVADGTETDVGDAYKNLSRRVGEIDVKAGEIDLRIRNRKVGGVNLLKGTAFDKLPERNTQNLSLGTDVSVKHYGRNYVAIDVSGATGALYRGVYLHTMTVARNIEYTASVYLRCDAPTALDEGAYLEVYTTKGADHTRQTWVTGARLTNNTAGQWKRLVVTFTTPDEDFDGLAVNIFVKQNGKVYVSEPQLEVGNVVTDWSENPDEVHDTILSIRDGAIDLTAKRFVVRSEQGAPIAIFADGKIKAEFLDATTIWAEILKAKHAKFEDLTVVGDSTFDGTVRAQSGKIGSFEIKDGSLIAEQKVTVGAGEQRVERRMELSSSCIIFDDKPYKMRVILGGTSTAFSYNVCAMQITSKSKALLNNTGIFLDVQGGQPADYTTDDGIPTGAHALYVEHGNICGLRHQVLRVKQSVVISKMTTVIRSVATSKITVTLPADCEDGQLYIIHPSSAGIIIAAQGDDQIVYYDEIIDSVKTVHRSTLTTTKLDLKDRKLAGISLVYDKTNKHWLSDFIDIPSAYWSN